jgi:hypothetical protein
MSRYELASRYYQRALNEFQEVLGLDHPDVADCLVGYRSMQREMDGNLTEDYVNAKI